MKCPNHLLRNAAGYCCVCGSFYCDECLTRHEGNLYCPKHYKPIAAKLAEQERLAQGRKRHQRHALVVHFRDGRREQGVSHAMNVREASFPLACEDNDGIATGKNVRVRFADVKYVANVKSYTGKFNAAEFQSESVANGTPIIVEFKDGEIVEGRTIHAYNPDEARFYIVPTDPQSNNINILVEHAAVKAVYSAAEWAAKQAEKKEVARQAKAAGTATPTVTTQEETMGDFYFEQHNYTGALEQYRIAYKKYPDSQRLRKKVLAATLNVGIGFVKRRDYPKALEWMDQALEIDPDNEVAKRKAKQLRKVIEKTQRRMQAYREGTLFSSGNKDDDAFPDLD
jgi:tetratricopeptide (TPR) repeat protein